MIQIPEWRKLRPRMLELMIRIQAGGPLIESDKETITEMNNTILIINELADIDGLMQEYLRKVTPEEGSMGESKSITEQIEEVCEEICNHYCKWPYEPIPEGKDEDWLCCDPESPCQSCPLNRLH